MFGLIEISYLKIPVVNIGDRQKNRERGNNVIDAKNSSISIQNAIKNIPYKLKKYKLEIANSGNTLIYNYDINIEKTGITALLNDLSEENIKLKDIQSKQSSLEDIFINIVGK